MLFEIFWLCDKYGELVYGNGSKVKGRRRSRRWLRLRWRKSPRPGSYPRKAALPRRQQQEVHDYFVGDPNLRLVLPRELAKIVVSEGTKAVTNWFLM